MALDLLSLGCLIGLCLLAPLSFSPSLSPSLFLSLDCFERAGELPKRFSDAGALLLTPMVGENGAQGSAFSKGTPHQLYEAGVQRVCLGGYPEVGLVRECIVKSFFVI